jgi:hypothetical protein
MAFWGAFAFGAVIGWLVYFTNRYRKGEVQFSDLTTLLGIVGGGAVTALFGEGKTELFGAYGLGLALGFFAYFVVLIVLVRNSGGAFTWAWFLDGRRRPLDPATEEIPSDTRPTVAPMAVQPSLAERMAVLEDRVVRSESMQPPAMMGLPVPARTPLAESIEQRDRVIAAVVDALRELTRRVGDTTDDAERAELRRKHEALTEKLDALVALRLRDIVESEQVKAALAQLGNITNDLVVEAKRMKAAADAIETAAKLIDRVTKLIGFLGSMFP